MKRFYPTLLSLIIICFSSISSIGQNLSSPFQILSFGAEAAGTSATITWSTGVEAGTHYFTVERTTDGITYTKIDSVKAAGNSDFQRDYQVTDNAPVAGTAYYRLTETSLDGSTYIYGMTSLNWSPEGSLVKTCFERQRINMVIISEQPETCSLLVTNLGGKVLLHQDLSLTTGENDFSIPVSFTDGLYIVNVLGDNVHYCKKLLIGSCAFKE
jgi:hypothetical protein